MHAYIYSFYSSNSNLSRRARKNDNYIFIIIIIIIISRLSLHPSMYKMLVIIPCAVCTLIQCSYSWQGGCWSIKKCIYLPQIALHNTQIGNYLCPNLWEPSLFLAAMWWDLFIALKLRNLNAIVRTWSMIPWHCH